VNRLLLDHGLPHSAATLLRHAGLYVVHVSEIGMIRASDADILQRARAEIARVPSIENALSSGALVTVTERSIRVRQLPIVRP